MRMQERGEQVGLKDQAIHGISRASHQEQRIAMEAEWLHSMARMKKPTAAASETLSRITVIPEVQHRSDPASTGWMGEALFALHLSTAHSNGFPPWQVIAAGGDPDLSGFRRGTLGSRSVRTRVEFRIGPSAAERGRHGQRVRHQQRLPGRMPDASRTPLGTACPGRRATPSPAACWRSGARHCAPRTRLYPRRRSRSSRRTRAGRSRRG